jgi:predicted O-linked N-acetylglucosamine transferase (SPINDLY family)
MATIPEALDLALQHHKAGNLDAAEQIYRQVLSIEPGNADALHLLGMVAYQRGQFAEAIESLNQAIALKASVPEFHNNLGEAYRAVGQADNAIVCYRRALALNEKYAEAHNNLGIVLNLKDKLEEAVASYRVALACKPDFAEAYNNLGNALQAQGQLDEAVACFRKAVTSKPDFNTAHSNMLLCMCFSPVYGPEAMAADHRVWNDRHACPLAAQIKPHENDRNPERRLRVGYVSSDFRAHAISNFFEPLVAAHDHENVEVFCYAGGAVSDQVTSRLQASAGAWRKIMGMNDEAVADRIYTDKIDILVDLSGHTAGHRLLVFARKPAPVQVTYLGSLTTTGLTAIDYKLTDRFLTPDGTAERFSEELFRLPHCFVCYQPPQGAPHVAPLPSSKGGQVTFGSFNNLSKLTPAVAGLWAQILHALPDARLVLKYASLTDAGQRKRFLDLFAQNGIPADRIELLSGTLAPAHLADYSRVDIGLDPFPYNGCTTTCEALWMGVPVITLAGVMSYSRFGVSLLSNLGMEDLIAMTPEAYVEKAVALAKGRRRLAALRAELRPRMAASVLCDAKAFARDVEQAYRSMWRRWCESHG